MTNIKPKNIWILLTLTFLGAMHAAGQDATPVVPAAYVAPMPVNYVRTIDALSPQTQLNLYMASSMPDILETTNYMDGFGRPLQKVTKSGAQPTNQLTADLVEAHVYDAAGREIRIYLPFAATDNTGTFKMNPFQQQSAFYSNTDPAKNPIANQGETFFYGINNMEASPLNRPLETFGAGNGWAGSSSQSAEADRKSTKAKYLVNTVLDAVRIWTVSDIAGNWGNYVTASTYSAGQLYKTVITNEDNHQSIEFKDRNGILILRKEQSTATNDNGAGSGHAGWLNTYYIYDDLSRLRAVIQPEGVKLLNNNSWDLTYSSSVILNEQCFRYEYDMRNKVIRQKKPGAGESWQVYDARGRLVLSQDANMRSTSKKQWQYNTYDSQNRHISTGLLTDNANYSNLSYHTALAFSSTSYPNLASYTSEEISREGYDQYEDIPIESGLSGTLNTTNSSEFLTTYNTAPLYAQPLIAGAVPKGMTSWTKVKVLNSSPAQYIYSIHIYDKKGRLLQIKATNISNGEDLTTFQYGWSGSVLRTVQRQTTGSGQYVIVVTNYSYDALKRLIKTEKKTASSLINNGAVPTAWATIAEHEYDALGQPVIKKIGRKKDAAGIYGTDAIENVKYEYNIRGWLLGANRRYLKENTADHFGFELAYDKRTSVWDNFATTTYTKEQYDGNIGGLIWRSAGDGEKRKYDFDYDAINRLLKADFTQNNGGWNTSAGVDFSMKMGDGLDNSTAYDENGNIKRMRQWGLKVGSSSLIDDLNYNYIVSSNKLLNVKDDVNDANSTLGDFKTSVLHPVAVKTTLTEDYSYDENGNLVKDLNKNLITASGNDGIIYNHLNLPEQVTVKKDASSDKGSINYVYSSGGAMLKKIITDNSITGKSVVTTTLYCGLAIYQTQQTTPANSPNDDYSERLLYIGQEEGRIRFTAAIGVQAAKLDYDYYLKDHLGNIRMVLTDELEQIIYPAATLEGSIGSTGSPNAVNLEQNYYEINADNIVDRPSEITTTTNYENNNLPAVVNNNPYSASGSKSEKMYRLQATGDVAATGLGITLKVMSGDKIDIFGKSYYNVDNTAETNHNLPILDLLTSLLGGTSGIGAAKGVTATTLNSIPAITGAVNGFLSNPARGGGTTPKAYINYILLDEQFNYVGGNFSRVGAVGSIKDHYADLQNIPITKNGYIYVYCSNESPVQVLFDNLQVIHSKGPVLEETHYYPFGLSMKGISSKAQKTNYHANKNLFNGGSELQSNEFGDGSGLELYATQMRGYDPQIGRFHQNDPMAVLTANQSTYSFAFNNPVFYNDPLGATPDPVTVDEDGNIIINWDEVGEYGGFWSPGGTYSPFTSDAEAFTFGAAYLDQTSAWGNYGFASNLQEAKDAYYGTYNGQDPNVSSVESVIVYGHYNQNNMWVTTNVDYSAIASSLMPPVDTDAWGFGLNAFGMANGAKTEILDWAARTGSTQTGIRAELQVFGKAGTKYLQGAKVLGKVAGFVSVGVTVLDAYQKGKWQGHHTADVIIGVGSIFALTGPVGWAIGGGYFLLDYGIKQYTGKSITENLFD